MFAVYASEPNPDEPLKSLTVGERPEPEVADGWVAVDVAAASLNMHDLWTLRGVGIKPDQFPMILGCDGAGQLADGTEVVLHSVIGDPSVAGDETLDPKRTLLTEKSQGTFADTVVVPARNAVPKPGGLSMAQAAVMGTAWLTAYRMPFVKSGLRPGQTMLVQGASGGVATALVQLGHAAGMQVWVTGRTDAKRAVAERLGADATFPSGARLPARVDAVFETVGEATWAHSMRALKPGGTVVVSGADERPEPRGGPATTVLPAAAGDRRDDGHPRRARGPAGLRRDGRDRPGDRLGAADGTGRGGFPGDAGRQHRREDRFYAR
jgi:NADPH:quinone reductase-like Zn-dependent oxidoreductase